MFISLDGRILTVAHYSSSLSPVARSSTLQRFQRGELDLLICTDALSRGMDLQQQKSNNKNDNSNNNNNNKEDPEEGPTGAKAIINYDAPSYIKTYIHRVGRTARAGHRGSAYTILAKHECRYWKEMMRKYQLYDGIHKLTDYQMREPLHERLSFDMMAERYQEAMQRVRQLDKEVS